MFSKTLSNNQIVKSITVLFFVSIFHFSDYSKAQQSESSLFPKIDKRVEFLNIIYQFAKHGKAIDTLNDRDTHLINEHFLKFKNHPVIVYTNNLIRQFAKDSIDIIEWELPSLAVHLSQPPQLQPLVDQINVDNSDGWDNRSLLNNEYIFLIQDFYKQTNAEKFFRIQEKYYKKIYQEYSNNGIIINKNWLDNFFRIKPSETYFPILTLRPNTGAYLRVNFENNKRNTHTIFGCNKFDSNGIPMTFGEPSFAWSILHEYIHCFCNQLIEKDSLKLKPSGQELLSNQRVYNLVKNTFYNNWRYLLYESLVRAVSIRYAMSNNKNHDQIESDIKRQEDLGFLWMKDLVEKLGIYENNRNKYNSFSKFMPQIIKAFENYANIYGSTPGDSLSFKLDEYFTALTSLKNFNGNVIIEKEGKVLLNKTYTMLNEADGLTVTKDSKFIIASVSKIFIKYAILRLVELKKLSLSDRLNKFISDFPCGDKITVEQLIFHKSGLPRELTGYEKDSSFSLNEIVELAKLEKLEFEPNTQTLYSNLGYFLLHYIIDKAAPKGYLDFIENEILIKYKLNNTGEYNAAGSLSNFAYGFNNENGIVSPTSIQSINKFETGNFYSTISDLYNFSNQLLSGKYLKNSLTKKLFEPDNVLVQAGGRPGYRAYFYMNLKTNITFIFLANYSDVPIPEVTENILNLLDNKPYQIPQKTIRKKIKLTNDILRRYEGKFALEADDKQIFIISSTDEKLFIISGEGDKTELFADSETTFFEVPTSNDGCVFIYNEQTNKYDLTIISTGIQLKTKRIE